MSRKFDAKASKYHEVIDQVYQFLTRPQGWRAASYHLFVTIATLLSVLLNVAKTVDQAAAHATFNLIVECYEVFILIVFITEHILRIWSSDSVEFFRGWRGKLKFLTSFHVVIDSFVIIATLVTVTLSWVFPYVRNLHISIIPQCFRLIKIDRYRGDIRLMKVR